MEHCLSSIKYQTFPVLNLKKAVPHNKFESRERNGKTIILF